jgi:hypothetical protein
MRVEVRAQNFPRTQSSNERQVVCQYCKIVGHTRDHCFRDPTSPDYRGPNYGKSGNDGGMSNRIENSFRVSNLNTYGVVLPDSCSNIISSYCKNSEMLMNNDCDLYLCNDSPSMSNINLYMKTGGSKATQRVALDTCCSHHILHSTTISLLRVIPYNLDSPVIINDSGGDFMCTTGAIVPYFGKVYISDNVPINLISLGQLNRESGC